MTEEQRSRIHHAVETSRYTIKSLMHAAIAYSARLEEILNGLSTQMDSSVGDNFSDAFVEASSLREVSEIAAASQLVLFEVALVSLDGQGSDELQESINSYITKISPFRA